MVKDVKYIVRLEPAERQLLLDLATKGKRAASVLTRARVLLKADAGAGGPGCSDEDIAEAVETSLSSVHRVRQVDIAKKLFGAMGIARDDKPMRQDWVLRGFRQFDAPVSLVLAYDRQLDPGAGVHFDLGALCYGIVLAAWDRGLGSVINGQGIMRSDIVRKVAKIPEDQVILTCVAMGYPDDCFAANGVRSDR